ncbi:DMT family transporter [Sphingobacterium alimentarium]|nr:DMT family transporter [Sphingobacterium alimentarium]
MKDQSVKYMLMAGFFFAIMNVCVKFVSHLPTLEVVLFRSIFSFVVTYYYLRKNNIPPLGNNIPVLTLRGIAGCLGLIGSFYTLQHIPLASAVTINYLSPFFTAILGIFIVKQSVRPVQFLYFALAIAGVFLLKGFDFRISTLDVIIGLSAALFAGIAYNMIARSKGNEHPLVVIFYFPLLTIPVVGIYTLFDWKTPIGIDWLYLLLIGICTQVAQYYMTLSYQSANLAKVASLNYLGVLYALGFGYIFYQETFNTMSLIGILVILIGVFLNLYDRQVYKFFKK